MSQKLVHYWVGNVTHMRLPPKYFSLGPDDMAIPYGSTRDQKPLAKVVPLSAAKKQKDVSRSPDV